MYSYDHALFNDKNGISDTETDTIGGTIGTNKDTISDISKLEMSLLSWIRQNASCTHKDYADKPGGFSYNGKALICKIAER